MKAYIDKRKCPASSQFCKPILECPEKAISWIEDNEEAFGARIVIDKELCTGCGVCVPLCCSDCIEVR